LSLCVACAASAKLDDESKLYALDAILSGRLKSNEQISGTCVLHLPLPRPMPVLTKMSVRTVIISAAVKYLETNPPPVDTMRFDTACGVGTHMLASHGQNALDI
jgi:hypothetical protein